MIGNLITQINKYLAYLGKKELAPDQNGITKLEQSPGRECAGPGGSEAYEIKEGCGIKHTWDVSYHNGDYFNHQVLPMSNKELVQLLELMEARYRAEAERKVKHELEVDAVKRRMVELGLLEGP